MEGVAGLYTHATVVCGVVIPLHPTISKLPPIVFISV